MVLCMSLGLGFFCLFVFLKTITTILQQNKVAEDWEALGVGG